jgi:hypothetical protein
VRKEPGLQGVEVGERSAVWVGGVVLGFAGALLDFYSGYLILTQSPVVAGEMGMVTSSSAASVIWGVGILALGAVLAITTFANGLRVSAVRMKDFGSLMVVYGFVMFFIGLSMYTGITSMTGGVFLPAYAMFVVGALMLANGVLMRQSYTRQKMT